MTPTAQYPRSRYVMMQVALFLVLLATVALANWVSHRPVAAAAQAGPISLGDFKLRLPPDWIVTQKPIAHAIQIDAVEPDETGREISVLYQELTKPLPPMDYLQRSGLVTGSWREQPMTVDGNPGAYIQMMRPFDRGDQRLLIKDLLACVVLPNGQVLTLQLTGPGKMDESDQQLMQEVLTNLQIQPQKKSPNQPTSQVWEGI